MLRTGRPVKLNQKSLEAREGRDYAEIVFFGDVHLGAHTCEIEKARKMLDYCLEKRIYVLGMGDMVECGLSNSVGGSVYAQKLQPQEQMEECIEFLTPIAEEGLLLGLLNGNHENRIFLNTGLHIMKIMCGFLKVPYLGDACWNLFRVGNQNYTCYAIHGSSGSRLVHTKIKSVGDVAQYFSADIVAMGHVHHLGSEMMERQFVDMRNKTIAHLKQYLVLTGHYLGYFGSYAQTKGMSPSKTGSPKAKLNATRKDVHISF
jgi:UDP-2,3-diacylglucosamine pyrophosphatase LpxH